MASTSCCQCIPCRKCLRNLSLWDDLVCGELTVPSLVINVLQSGVPKEDIVEPLFVPDPRDKECNLLRVRTHWNGAALVQTYDQCTADGTLLFFYGHWAEERNVKGIAGGNMGSLVIPSKGSVSNAGFCKKSNCEEGVYIFTAPEVLKKPWMSQLVIVFMAQERRPQPVSSFSALQADRRLGLFCDVTLCVDGKDFPAHKAVLAACSDVFRTMFTSDFRERSAARVDVKGTTAEAFGDFLDFLYTDKHPGWHGCLVELVKLADQYQVHRMKRMSEAALWCLRDANSALGYLLRAATTPILAPAVQSRLCRIVARGAAGLKDTADWKALQKESPLVAGAICGMEDAGGVFAPIVHCCDGLPVREGAEDPA